MSAFWWNGLMFDSVLHFNKRSEENGLRPAALVDLIVLHNHIYVACVAVTDSVSLDWTSILYLFFSFQFGPILSTDDNDMSRLSTSCLSWDRTKNSEDFGHSLATSSCFDVTSKKGGRGWHQRLWNETPVREGIFFSLVSLFSHNSWDSCRSCNFLSSGNEDKDRKR